MSNICNNTCIYYIDYEVGMYFCTKNNKCDEIGGKNPYIMPYNDE